MRSEHGRRGNADGRAADAAAAAPAANVPFPAELRALRLRRRADAVLARPPGAPIRELDELLTDACAAVLMLEARRERIDRERAVVLTVADGDPGAEIRAGELEHRASVLRDEAERLRALIAPLSARRRAHERGQRH